METKWIYFILGIILGIAILILLLILVKAPPDPEWTPSGIGFPDLILEVLR